MKITANTIRTHSYSPFTGAYGVTIEHGSRWYYVGVCNQSKKHAGRGAWGLHLTVSDQGKNVQILHSEGIAGKTRSEVEEKACDLIAKNEALYKVNTEMVQAAGS